MAELVKWSLILWVATHSASELFGALGAKKPLSCQKCLAGWFSLFVAPFLGIDLLVAWAISVLIEAVYQRLTVILL